MRAIAVLVCLVLSAAAVRAQPRPYNPLYGEPADFFGTWNNIELRRNMIVRIEIRPEVGRGVRVTVFGLRDGQPCFYGEYLGKFYVARYPREREQDNSAILVRVELDFVRGHVLLRFNGRGEIVSHALLSFADREPLYSVERFATAGRRAYGGEFPPPPPRPYYPGY